MLKANSSIIKSILIDSIKSGDYFKISLNMKIASILDDIRISRGISNDEFLLYLSDKLGLYPDKVSDYLVGVEIFDTELLGKLSIVLEIEFDINFKNINISSDKEIEKLLE